MKSSMQQQARKETHLYLLPKMQKGLHFLELPLLELSAAIQKEMEENPLLESEEESDADLAFLENLEKRNSPINRTSSQDFNTLLENSLACENSLFDQLMAQAKERLSQDELPFARAIIGNLEPSGFLKTPLYEIASLLNLSEDILKLVLKKIQGFDPPGIAASSLQESLLLQLKRKHLEKSLAFFLVEHFFPEISRGKFYEIAKRVKQNPNEIKQLLLKELSSLHWHPGADLPKGHYKEALPAIVADLFIDQEGEELLIRVNDEKLPRIRFNQTLLAQLSKEMCQKELHRFVKEKVTSGKWLLRYLFDREKTLYRIGEKIVEKQKAYLTSPKGQLKPWTMKELAQDLSLHESTIVRAIQNKYVFTPRGVLPLRSFFTHSMEKSDGAFVSANQIKEIVKELIQTEDPRNPLSDEAIVVLLKKRGYLTARRTVAKYRSLFHIASSSHRRHFDD